jgi:ribosomal protein L28
LQRVRVRDENGTVKRVWVSTKAIRSGLVNKA